MLSLNVQIGSNPLLKHNPKDILNVLDIEQTIKEYLQISQNQKNLLAKNNVSNIQENQINSQFENDIQNKLLNNNYNTNIKVSCLSIGSVGEIIGWAQKSKIIYQSSSQQQKQNLQYNQKKDNLYPIYQMIPSIDGDTGKLVSAIIWPLKVLYQQETTLKVITLHQDNRLRIWQLADGVCSSISTNQIFFQKKVVGFVENHYNFMTLKKNKSKIQKFLASNKQMQIQSQNQKVPSSSLDQKNANISKQAQQNLINVDFLDSLNFESRFIFAFGDQAIYVIDSWQMKVIKTIQPQVQTYVKFVKGVINDKKQLQLLDNHSKTYKITILNQLFSQKFIDVGSYVSNNQKAFEQLYKVLDTMSKPKVSQKYKRWDDQLEKELKARRLNQIKYFIQKQKNSKNQVIDQLFNINFKSSQKKLKKKHSLNQLSLSIQQKQTLKRFFKDQQPTVSNLFFIKSNRLWYFIGTKSGKICGFPVVKENDKEWAIVFDHPCKYPVKYIHLTDNLLVVSWQNGLLSVYTVDNHDYIIDQQAKKRRQINSKQKQNEMKAQNLKQEQQIYKQIFISMKQSILFSKKLPNYIKYNLKIHSLQPNHSPNSNSQHHQTLSMKINTLLAYQLHNNQVILIDNSHKNIQHFRGISEDPSQKVYVVLFIQDHIGIAHSSGIDLYNGQKFQRQIQYDKWQWNDYLIFDKIQWPEDYHNLQNKNILGTDIIQFCNRFFYKKVDYYSANQNQLLYESFGLIDDEKLQNDTFPTFYFQQKTHCENSIHSKCGFNSTSVLKLKTDNIRRDYWYNTSFLLHGNISKQLQSVDSQPQVAVKQDFVFYSLFGWQIQDNIQILMKKREKLIQKIRLKSLKNGDQNTKQKAKSNVMRQEALFKQQKQKGLSTSSASKSQNRSNSYLKTLIQSTEKTFVLKKRFVEQGIGKTFTLYFDYYKQLFYLKSSKKSSLNSSSLPILTKAVISSQNYTFHAIATTTFLQACSNRFFSVADQMVTTVQKFSSGLSTSTNQKIISLDGQILSKMTLSENQNMMKACINLLMSTVLSYASNFNITTNQKQRQNEEMVIKNSKKPVEYHQFVQKQQFQYSKGIPDSPLKSPTKAFKFKQKSMNMSEFYLKEIQNQQLQKSPSQTKKIMLINLLFLKTLNSQKIINKVNLHPTYDYFILNMKNIQQSKNKMISSTQCHWIVLMGICVVYGIQKIQTQQVKTLVGRILQSIDLLNFQLRPDLLIVVMRVLAQGITKWKNLLNSQQIIKFLTDLFKIFFYYDGINSVSSDDKKFNFCFEKIPHNQAKKMKQSIVRTIIYISKEFNSQFLQVLRNQALSQKIHLAYPSSVIQILRQYIKSEKPASHLVFYIQLLLQCLSPMTPQLRKYVQKNVLATLQLMCSYKTISFNQPSQKLSLLTHSHIYIYCLRTSTKWRTINIKNQKNQQKEKDKERQSNNSLNTEKMDKKGGILLSGMALQMSPKGTYIALLNNSRLQVWRLSSGFWSGVLGAFSQGWNFEAQGNSIKWQQNEQSITVINPNPSKNKNYKL